MSGVQQMTGYEHNLPRVLVAKQKAEQAKAEEETQRLRNLESQNYRQHQIDSLKLELDIVRQKAALPKANREQIRNICEEFYSAIDGLGTKNTQFEMTLDKIDKANVLEVMDMWDKSYGKEYGETFIQSFLNDANTRQKAVWGTHIIEALEQRAENFGLDISQYTVDARKEVKTFGNNKDLINENIEKIRTVLQDTNY